MIRYPVLFCSIALLVVIVSCGCGTTQDQATGDGGRLPPATAVPAPPTLRAGDQTTGPSVPATRTCVPDWSCLNWSACNSSGTQVRVCEDRNHCGTVEDRPQERQTCTYTPPAKLAGPFAIRVAGDYVCTLTANSALDNLKYRASPDYEYVRKYVGEINCSVQDMCYMSRLSRGDSPFYTVCIAYMQDPPTVYVDQPYWNADPVWLAGVLVHEACHSEGYYDYVLSTDQKYDLSEFSDWKGERRCCDRMRTTWNQLGAPAFNDDLYRYCSL